MDLDNYPSVDRKELKNINAKFYAKVGYGHLITTCRIIRYMG
jgi:hypothetical protein